MNPESYLPPVYTTHLDQKDLEISKLKNEVADLNKKINDIESLFSSEEVEHQIDSHVKDVFDFTIKKLIPFIDKLDFYSNKYEQFDRIKKNFDYWANLKQKPWLEGKITIALLGKFSSGKSSIINAILKDDLLPIATTPSTAVSTYISYGSTLRIKYSTDEASLREVDPSFFKSLKKSFFDKIKLSGLIKYFVIEHPNKSLRNISILDTPGYDSGDAEDRKRAMNVVSECNYIFWIVDINEGQLRKDAIDFIKKELEGKPLYVIVSKADSKPLEKQRTDVVNLIRSTLNTMKISFEDVILFSNRNSMLLPV